MKKVVLVTGATGAIGSSLFDLLSGDFDKVVYGINTTFEKDRILKIDLRCKGSVEDLISTIRPDIIYHLASIYSNDIDESYATNVLPSKYIYEAINKNRLNTRVLVAGSAAEYGFVVDEENPISEKHLTNPLSAYGLTKLWQTQQALFYSRMGLDVVIARIFNVIGKNLSDNLFVGRVEKKIDDLLSGAIKYIELGNLDGIRDYISVADAVKQMVSIANYGAPGNIYNVGSGKPVSMKNVLSNLLNERGLDFSIIKPNYFVTKPHIEVKSIFADMTKTNRLIK